MHQSPPLSLTYDEYQERGYLPSLDGLRAISVLLVVAVHVDYVRQPAQPIWAWLSGQTGVRVFFVLSGYLITMLGLREEDRRSKLSLSAFYVRRCFRILPAYYATLLLYCALIFWSGLSAGLAHAPYFRAALGYYLAYANEFAPPAPFYQSWSLGVEEKFYLLWPLLGFVLLRGGFLSRLLLAAAVGLGLQAFRIMDHPLRFWAYGDILIGCAVAILLHRQVTYTSIARLGTPNWGYASAAIALTLQCLYQFSNSIWGVFYPFGIALLVVHLLLGRSAWIRALERPLICHIGRLSYSIYLLHILCIQAVCRMLPAGGGVATALLASLLSALLAIGAAEVMHRLLEKPLIGVGKRISGRILQRASAH